MSGTGEANPRIYRFVDIDRTSKPPVALFQDDTGDKIPAGVFAIRAAIDVCERKDKDTNGVNGATIPIGDLRIAYRRLIV
jgi:hypothetical protein